MNFVPTNPTISANHGVLLAIANSELVGRMCREVSRFMNGRRVSVAHHLHELRETSSRLVPDAIFLDSELLGAAPLLETVRQIAAFAPVILLGSSDLQTEAARLVATGEADFLVRAGDFVPLAAALLERRLRWAEISKSALGPAWREFSEDIGEIFRHEINNPLTGILGNAELLLAHRDRLAAVDTQRLQTVVDLAVRLRETVRRVGNAWEHQPPTLKSA